MPTTNSKTHKEKDRLSRDDIIATAAHLIAEQGLEHLTMRNIATSVGCSVGTLPHYFEGKDDIVIAALHWSSERIFSRLDNIKKRDLDLDKLYPLMSTSMPTSTQSDIEWRVRLCLWDYAATNEEMRLSVNAISMYAQETLASLLLHLQSQKHIRKGIDIDICAATIYHLCVGAGFSMLHRDMDQREKELAPLFSFIDSIKA